MLLVYGHNKCVSIIIPKTFPAVPTLIGFMIHPGISNFNFPGFTSRSFAYPFRLSQYKHYNQITLRMEELFSPKVNPPGIYNSFQH